MGRYDAQNSANRTETTSIWKIIIGVTLGIVLAGIITTMVRLYLITAVISGFGKAMEQSIPQVPTFRQLNNIPASLPIPDIQAQKPLSLNQPPIIIKTKEVLIKERSQQAYTQVQKELVDFKSQYIKPAECYDIKDSATRTHCANAFIKARKAYVALNKF